MKRLKKVDLSELVDRLFDNMSCVYSPYLTDEIIRAYIEGVTSAIYELIDINEFDRLTDLRTMLEDQAEERYPNIY